MPHEAAVAELQANTGTQFDPRIVTALVKVTEQGALRSMTTSEGVRALLAGAPVPQSAGAAS
jgi:HD-GYP domain-containing protein (c-di-GMP phosphodiesterase class II)